MKTVSDNGAWIIDPDENPHFCIDRMSKILTSLVSKYKPSLIYDFGCGQGQYPKYIRDATGIDVVGFEAYPDYSHYDNIKQIDLSKSFTLEPADMSISLEVGEHIPAEFEQIFLDNLCNNTKKYLVLSWAIEGQDGIGHINCRNNDYIISELDKRGFSYDETSEAIRDYEDLLWFKNTFMIFYRR